MEGQADNVSRFLNAWDVRAAADNAHQRPAVRDPVTDCSDGTATQGFQAQAGQVPQDSALTLTSSETGSLSSACITDDSNDTSPSSSSAASEGSGDVGHGFGAAERRLRWLRAQLKAAAAENARLRIDFRIASVQAVTAKHELQWMQLDAEHGRAALVKHARLLGPPSHARPDTAGALVSVFELPSPDGWDAAWCDRVRSLRTLDVLQMHRQFLQRCAMILPKAELLRDATPDEAELEQLCSRYDAFTQQVMRLAPQPWLETISFSLDTMEPLPQQLDTQVILPYTSDLTRFWSHSEVQAYGQIKARYAQVRAELSQEAAELQERLQRLSAGGGAAAGFPHDSADSVEAGIVAGQLEANLQQQAYEHRNLLQNIQGVISAVSVSKVRLAMYPWALNGQSWLIAKKAG